MPVAVFGLNHNTAPIEIREKLFVSEDAIPNITRELKEKGIDENIVLSTCNRTEFYFSCENPEQPSINSNKRFPNIFIYKEIG